MLCSLSDSTGIVAIRNLPDSNMSTVLSTSVDVVNALLDKLVDDGENNASFYLLDSNGFVVWTSEREQSQMGGQHFAELQPLVFANMVNKSVFIAGTFTGYEPRPCEVYSRSHSATTACLGSAAPSLHKVCSLTDSQLFGVIFSVRATHKQNLFQSFITFGLWLITDGLRMVALATYYRYLFVRDYITFSMSKPLQKLTELPAAHDQYCTFVHIHYYIELLFSMLGCIMKVYHLLSMPVGYAQYAGPELDRLCCQCSINLCLDFVTAVQLDPNFTDNITNQIVCPDDNNKATM